MTPQQIARQCRYRILAVCGYGQTYTIFCTDDHNDPIVTQQVAAGSPWPDIDACVTWGLREGLWVSREVALATLMYGYTAAHYASTGPQHRGATATCPDCGGPRWAEPQFAIRHCPDCGAVTILEPGPGYRMLGEAE